MRTIAWMIDGNQHDFPTRQRRGILGVSGRLSSKLKYIRDLTIIPVRGSAASFRFQVQRFTVTGLTEPEPA